MTLEPARARAWVRAGALAIEMEAAALLRVGELRGVRVACLLAVSDVFDAAGARRAAGRRRARRPASGWAAWRAQALAAAAPG